MDEPPSAPEDLLGPLNDVERGNAPQRTPVLRCPLDPDKPWPRVDDHLVEPEATRDEVLRGQRMQAMGALPPHADCQARLTTVLSMYARPGYVCASELQTRSAFDSDFASDFCIRKEGLDPRTGVRYLEELVCEVVSEQKPGHILAKAEDLSARGVRRILGIFVKEKVVREWAGGWRTLPISGVIEDECLVRPLPVRAIVDAAEADDAVMLALVAKKNRVLLQALGEERKAGHDAGVEERHRAGAEKGHRAGVEEGLRVAVGAVSDLCDLLGIGLSAERQAALARMGTAELEALRLHLKQHRAWPQPA